jgi:hypothetical protein
MIFSGSIRVKTLGDGLAYLKSELIHGDVSASRSTGESAYGKVVHLTI